MPAFEPDTLKAAPEAPDSAPAFMAILPLAFVRRTLFVPPVEETLSNTIASGWRLVVLLNPVMLTAFANNVLMVPLVVVTVPGTPDTVLLIKRPATPLAGELWMRMPTPPGFVTVVAPTLVRPPPLAWPLLVWTKP